MGAAVVRSGPSDSLTIIAAPILIGAAIARPPSGLAGLVGATALVSSFVGLLHGVVAVLIAGQKPAQCLPHIRRLRRRHGGSGERQADQCGQKGAWDDPHDSILSL